MIDAGCGNEQEALFEDISEVLPREVEIKYLLLTHCHYDHTGGAEAARNRYPKFENRNAVLFMI